MLLNIWENSVDYSHQVNIFFTMIFSCERSVNDCCKCLLFFFSPSVNICILLINREEKYIHSYLQYKIDSWESWEGKIGQKYQCFLDLVLRTVGYIRKSHPQTKN